MRAVVRSITCFDVDDLDAWRPADASWAIHVRVFAGPGDGPGEESFDLTGASVSWLAERVRRDGVYDGRHHLVVDSYRWQAIRAFIQRRVQACDGPTWDDVAGKLARIGHWELEDYQP